MEMSLQPLPLHFLRSHSQCGFITNSPCVKTCLPQSTNCDGCIWATGVHLLQTQTVWVLWRTEVISISHQLRVCEFPLGRSQISHSKFHFPVSQLSSFPSDTGNSAAAGKESLSKNSDCMIKDFSDPYGYLKLEQTEGKAGIKL